MKQEYTRYYPIPTHPNYGVTADGVVIDFTTMRRAPCDFKGDIVQVHLGDEVVPLPLLLAHAFIGPIDLPVGVRRRGNPNMARDISYVYDAITFDDNDHCKIDGIKFTAIPGYDRYFISEDGVVFDMANPHFVHRSYTTNGFATVQIVPDGTTRDKREVDKVLVQRLVYITYVGPIEEGMYVGHRDNCIHHNHYTNLMLRTRGQTVVESFASGGNQDRRRWTEDQLKEICHLMERNCPNEEIAELVGVPYDEAFTHLLTRLKTGVSYKELASNYDIAQYKSGRSRSGMSDADRETIKQLVAEGKSLDEIFKHFDGRYNKQLIYRTYKKDGVTTADPHGKGLSPEQVAVIKADIDSGLRAKAVCEKYGIGEATFYRIKSGTYANKRKNKSKTSGE
jgi:hypothetical protein